MKKVNLTDTQKTGLEFLNLNTLIQRENYIKAVVDYNINKLETAVLKLEELTGIKRNAWNRLVYSEVRKEFPRPDFWDYHTEKITSDEYYSFLTKQHEKQPTEIKLINYIKNIIEETGNTAFNKLSQIDDITSKWQKQTLRDEWTTEANQTFEKRLIYMVTKLDEFGFISENVNLSKDEIKTSVENDFEFWISATDNLDNYLGRVHARLIWVNGTQYCSHYRFITTLKK